MELRTIAHFIVRRWWLIALPALVALVLALPQVPDLLAPPVSYAAQIRLTAATPPDAENPSAASPYEDSAYVPFLASEYVVVNLPAWITSASFAREVSEDLAARGVEIAPADLRPAFAADSFRSVLTLYVGWDDPDELRAIAESAITVLQTRNQAYLPQSPVPLEVVPWDEVSVSQVAPPLVTRFEPILRVAVGLAAGLALALLVEYLDRSVQTGADVEALGLALIGEIPPER